MLGLQQGEGGEIHGLLVVMLKKLKPDCEAKQFEAARLKFMKGPDHHVIQK